MMALGACSSGNGAPSSPEETTQASQQAVTSVPGTYVFHVTLPSGTSIVNATVGAAGPVSVGSRTTISGLVAAGAGATQVQADAVVGPVTAAGSIALGDRVKVGGDVTAGGNLTVTATTSVSGAIRAHADTTTKTVSWSVTAANTSSGGIVLGSSQVAAPVPGVYDDVIARAGSSLYFEHGHVLPSKYQLGVEFEPRHR